MAVTKFCSGALLLLSLPFCNSRQPIDDARQMASAYADCTARYEQILEKNGPQASAGYNRALAEKKTELEKLLLRHGSGKLSGELELMRSRIMIELGRYPEAREIITRLSDSRSGLALEAKLQHVHLLLLQGRPDAAQALLKTIEPVIKKDSQLFRIYLAMVRMSPERHVRKEYALKLVNSPELPVALKSRIPGVYSALAATAREDRQMELARSYLEKALALSSDPLEQTDCRAQIRQLALIGLPAPSLAAETWFNSTPLTPTAIRGQVLVIAFWSAWCPSSRILLSTLQDDITSFRNQGLQVIACTKLYGLHAGAGDKKTKIGAVEELASIRSLMLKNNISFPVAVGSEGLHFEAYAITNLPTLVFIDRRGYVVQIRSGAGLPATIREQIKLLLAEK